MKHEEHGNDDDELLLDHTVESSTSLRGYVYGNPALILTMLELADHYSGEKAKWPARAGH